MCERKIKKWCIEHDNFMFIVEDYHRYLDLDELALMAIVAQTLWMRLNIVVFARPLSPLNTVVFVACGEPFF